MMFSFIQKRYLYKVQVSNKTFDKLPVNINIISVM